MELDFFTGYHGAGKTYAANELMKEMDAEIADTGPIIRADFASSGICSFDEWNRQRNIELGDDYSNIIVINGLMKIINLKKPEHLFVVGNRDISGIDYIRHNLEEDGNSKILFFEKPFSVMKHGYETRTGKQISSDDFFKILQDDEDRGVLGIKKYCEAHRDMCDIIESDTYDRKSIELAKQAILNNRR